MTETPPPSKSVAELEQQLAEAAAKVAQVQAELSQARAADPNVPQVPTPYAGTAPVVMINGQQVPGGQAVDLSTMMGAFFGGAAGAGQAVTIPPVVTVNGQVVSGGQPVDLASAIGAEQLASIRQVLDQLGLGGQLDGVLRPAASPGEVTSSAGTKAMLWLAALLVLGLIGVVVYLSVTG